jgi:hypothetical protein
MAISNLKSRRRKILISIALVIIICAVAFGIFYGLMYRELDQALENCIKGIRFSKASLIPLSQNSSLSNLNITITFENPSGFLIKMNNIFITCALDQQPVGNIPPLPILAIDPGQSKELSAVLSVANINEDQPHIVSGTGVVEGESSYLFITIHKSVSVDFGKVIG